MARVERNAGRLGNLFPTRPRAVKSVTATTNYRRAGHLLLGKKAGMRVRDFLRKPPTFFNSAGWILS